MAELVRKLQPDAILPYFNRILKALISAFRDDSWPVSGLLSHAVLCCAVLCCAVLCCAVLCCAVLCCAVLCCAAAALCHAVLYCTMLPCNDTTGCLMLT